MTDMGNLPKLAIDAETREAWEQAYQRLIQGAGSDAEELSIIDTLVQRVRQEGIAWTESGREFVVGVNKEWDAKSVATAARLDTDMTGQAPEDARRKFIIFAGGLVVITILLIVGAMFMFSNRGGGGTSPRRTPTVNPADTVGEQVPILVDTGKSGGKMPMDYPRSIEVGGVPFTVLVGKVEKSGRLVIPKVENVELAAIWVVTPVNWSLALDEKVVRSVNPGDVILARTGAGRAVRFLVDDVYDADPQAIENLDQSSPGLTLFPLVSSTTNIRIVRAHYDFTGEELDLEPIVAQFGTGVEVVNGQVAVSGVFVEARTDSQYNVVVLGEARVDAGAGAIPLRAVLDIGGQVYNTVEPVAPLGDGQFRLVFRTPSLGVADIMLNEQVLSLGELPQPRLQADLVEAVLDEQGESVAITFTVMADGGAASVRPGDIALSVSSGTGSSSSQIAPVSVKPGERVVAGYPAETVTATFQLPRAANKRPVVFNVSLFGQAWEVEFP